jgi:RNase P subunit RPR2
MAEVIPKYNSGVGALICSECGAILKEGSEMMERIWESNGKIYMVYCVKCGRENYAAAVSSGQCAWCGYKATKKDIKETKDV